MNARIVPASVAALALLVAGACGSSAKQASSTTTAKPPKLALAAAGTDSGAKADAAAIYPMPIRPTSYVLDGDLPDLGTQAVVYRWAAHAATADDVSRFAAALGIDGTPEPTDSGFKVSDANATLEVVTTNGATNLMYYLGGPDASGGSSGSSSGSTGTAGDGTTTNDDSVSIDVPPDPGDATDQPAVAPPVPEPTGTIIDPPAIEEPVDVPSADDAAAAARALLDKMGVLAGQQWDTKVDDGGVAVACAEGTDCTTDPAPVTSRYVTLTLVLDGKRVEGVAWYVTIGSHGRVESLDGEWGSAETIGTYPLRTTAAAFDDLKRGNTPYGRPLPAAGGAVQAQEKPVDDPAATAVPGVTPDPAPDTPVSAPPVDEPVSTAPVDVHVTGAALGLARWDAYDGKQSVFDIVPVYLFHVRVEGSPAYDETALALDSSAIDFGTPDVPPVPEPKPLGDQTGAPPESSVTRGK